MTALIGHDVQEAAFRDTASSGRMHHAWLLAGIEGVGKGSFARQAAAWLLARATGAGDAESFRISENHSTAKLIAAGSHPDLILLERLKNEKKGDTARGITIDQVRQLTARFATTPSQADRRVVVIDAIDDLERGAANALLKSLEEPPASTIFLLVSHAPGRLLPTIRSRCTVLRFARLSDDAMTSALRRSMPDVDGYELQALVAAGAGSPAKALRFAGLDLAGLDAALDTISRNGDPSNAARLDLARKLSLKSAQGRYEAFLARVPVFIAEAARTRTGSGLAIALEHWEQSKSLSESAVHNSLDAQATIFQLASHVAALAPANRAAKA